MSRVGEFAAAAWRDGLGPDDRAAIRALAGRPGEDRAFDLFVAWLRLLSHEPVEVPPGPDDPPSRVLHAAARVESGRLAGHLDEVEAAIDDLTRALATLEPDDPRGDAARAWSDLALGDLAVQLADVAAARRRFEAVAASGRPVALRIAAMLQLAGLALDRVEIEPARNWARKATALAETAARPLHAARARLLWGLLDYAAADLAAMRTTLGVMIERGEGGAIARLLLANAERGQAAMQLLADGLRDAGDHADPLAYALCVLVGARRYVTMGRKADGLVTITAGIIELGKVAPPFAKILEMERAEWKRTWGSEYAQVEQAALQLLEPRQP